MLPISHHFWKKSSLQNKNKYKRKKTHLQSTNHCITPSFAKGPVMTVTFNLLISKLCVLWETNTKSSRWIYNIMFRKLRVKFIPIHVLHWNYTLDEVICLDFFYAVVFLFNIWFVFLFASISLCSCQNCWQAGKKKKGKEKKVVMIYKTEFPRIIIKKKWLRSKQRLKMAYA